MSPKVIESYALRLRGIRVRGHVGVSASEREIPQELLVAVDVELSGERYPSADELALAADYAVIVNTVSEVARSRSALLLESFALVLARRLDDLWPEARRVRVGITKARVPVTPLTDEATVEVVLGSESR